MLYYSNYNIVNQLQLKKLADRGICFINTILFVCDFIFRFFNYLLLAVLVLFLGLFSRFLGLCGMQGLLLIAAPGLLIVVASLGAEPGL